MEPRDNNMVAGVDNTGQFTLRKTHAAWAP